MTLGRLLIVAGAMRACCAGISPVSRTGACSTLNLAEAKKLACEEQSPVCPRHVLDAAASMQVPTEYRGGLSPDPAGQRDRRALGYGEPAGRRRPEQSRRCTTGLPGAFPQPDWLPISAGPRNLVDMAKLRADAQQQTLPNRTRSRYPPGHRPGLLRTCFGNTPSLECGGADRVRRGNYLADQSGGALASSKLKIGVGCQLCQRQPG
jgi:hypothetical protein